MGEKRTCPCKMEQKGDHRNRIEPDTHAKNTRGPSACAHSTFKIEKDAASREIEQTRHRAYEIKKQLSRRPRLLASDVDFGDKADHGDSGREMIPKTPHGALFLESQEQSWRIRQGRGSGIWRMYTCVGCRALVLPQSDDERTKKRRDALRDRQRKPRHRMGNGRAGETIQVRRKKAAHSTNRTLGK